MTFITFFAIVMAQTKSFTVVGQSHAKKETEDCAQKE